MEKITVENKSKYTLLSYLFLVLTIFIVLLFTKDLLSQTALKYDALKESNNKLEEKTNEYKEIEKIKQDIESWKIDKKELDKYLVKFNENELIEYFYNYANTNPAKLKITSINISKWTLNEFWFKEWKIDLQVMFADEKSMLDMLSFINTSDKYKMFVHELTYPYWNTTQTFTTTIPIKVLYK